MKKLVLTAAIAAATVSVGAQAATSYDITSNVTQTGLFLGVSDVVAAPGSSASVSIGGTALDSDDNGTIDSSNVTLTGTANFNAGPDVQLSFNLSGGNFVDGVGTTFTAGTIEILTDTGGGFVPYGSVDASVTPLAFTNALGGHLGQGTSTGGLQLAPGTNALPGYWDGAFFGPLFTGAVSSILLFGNNAGMYLAGDITLTASAVPVPAAAWLFGSALVGLAGARKRKA